MKKIINNPADVVKEALQGMQAAYEGTLDYTPGAEVISRHEKGDKVGCSSFRKCIFFSKSGQDRGCH